MAEKKLSVEVNVLNLDVIESLLLVLDKHRDELPCGVLQAIDSIAKSEGFVEYDISYVNEKGFSNGVIYADGIKVDKALSLNPITKRVKALDSKDIYPKTARLCGLNHDGSEVELASW